MPPPAERQERVASYLLAAAQRRHPFHWRQGKRSEPLAHAGAGPAMGVLSQQRIKSISELALRGLDALGSELPVLVSEQPVSAGEILRWQARGGRVVTLLAADAVCPAPHEGALDFALHDLCHLAKFSDPAHHLEQVGFFRAIESALRSPRWLAEEPTLDAEWVAARDAVCSDMNGSSIFLLSVLKMKLKMAARRRLAARLGEPAQTSGALSADEEREFRALLLVFLDALGLAGALAADAVAVSARRDSPAAATRLCRHFEALARQP